MSHYISLRQWSNKCLKKKVELMKDEHLENHFALKDKTEEIYDKRSHYRNDISCPLSHPRIKVG